MARAQVALSVGLDIQSPAEFYTPLSPYGSWVQVGSYGRCWHPTQIATGWRPYTMGHWEWSDSGWYWVSDEPWAWACYHYGYWALDPVYGWVWVPGTEWAPAWVVWREAPDYIGWAPCGPGGAVVADSFFVFCDVHHFHDRLRPQELVFNDPGLIRRSHRVGGFRTETRDFDGVQRRIAFNQGPSPDPIQRATGTRFTPRPVTELVRQTPVPESVRRNLSRPERQRVQPTTPEQTPSRTGREQQRLYREAPPATPPPTGRQEQRLYHEAPTRPAQPPVWEAPAQPAPRLTQPAPEIRRQAAPEVRSQPVPAPRQPLPEARNPRAPEFSRSPAAVPEQPLPPTGREPGRPEPEAPQFQQPPARVAPAPPPALAPQRPERERQREHEGQ